MKKLITGSIILQTLCFLVSGCSLPNGGPLAGSISNTHGTKIVKVTPDLAKKMVLESQEYQKKLLDYALIKLAYHDNPHDYTLGAGDKIKVSLWAFSSSSSGQTQSESSNSDSSNNGPSPISLGTFQLDTHGFITLPYAGKLKLSGLTNSAAEDIISKRYTALKILQSPAASVTITSGLKNSILVTGSIDKPSVIPWNPGGLTAAEALTLTMGGKTSSVTGDQSTLKQKNTTTVSIYRSEKYLVSLPFVSALENSIALQPGDKLIVRSQPVVNAMILGGGASKPGNYGFGEIPSLAKVLSQAQGLNPNAANAQHIFIFRQKLKEPPILYDFNFDNGTGVLTTQTFPVQDQDIVYIAESPLVPVARVLNIIFQMMMPATLAR